MDIDAKNEDASKDSLQDIGIKGATGDSYEKDIVDEALLEDEENLTDVIFATKKPILPRIIQRPKQEIPI